MLDICLIASLHTKAIYSGINKYYSKLIYNIYTVDGTCYDLPKGNRNIKTIMSPCPGYADSLGYSFWNSASSMMVQEILPQTKVQGRLIENHAFLYFSIVYTVSHLVVQSDHSY